MLRVTCAAVIGALPLLGAVSVGQEVRYGIAAGKLTLSAERAGVMTPLLASLRRGRNRDAGAC